MSILQVGATPVFCDVDDNGIMCLELKYITPKTKAIIGIDFGGLQCINPISFHPNYENIIFIRDAAHSMGLERYDLEADYITFSCQAIKSVPGGDLGILCVRDQTKLERIRKLAWFGMDKDNIFPDEAYARGNKIEEIGYKYNTTDIASALVLGNLEDLEQRIKLRWKKHYQYLEWIDRTYKGMYIEDDIYPNESTMWLQIVLHKKRNEIVKFLRDSGIQCGAIDRCIYHHPLFKQYKTQEIPGVDMFDNTYFCIPCHENLTDEEVFYIASKINEFNEKYDNRN